MNSLSVEYTITHIITFKRVCNNKKIYEKKLRIPKKYMYVEDGSVHNLDDLHNGGGDSVLCKKNFERNHIDYRRDSFFSRWKFHIAYRLENKYTLDDIKSFINEINDLDKNDMAEIDQILNHKILTKYRTIVTDGTHYQKCTAPITIQHIITLEYTDI